MLTHPVLNTLAQQQRVGDITGEMLLNGHGLDSSFRKNVGFCQQMDIHDESSTIREAFEFSALLRQSSDIPRREKIEYVDTVLNMLELVEIQDVNLSLTDSWTSKNAESLTVTNADGHQSTRFALCH